MHVTALNADDLSHSRPSQISNKREITVQHTQGFDKEREREVKWITIWTKKFPFGSQVYKRRQWSEDRSKNILVFSF